ncbi:MAG TPA: hypothetical protein VD969_27320 [Symbiobacteriaceae bacterium]|nr:hypothetical protein [Symbiobacteriaceae bacterium]
MKGLVQVPAWLLLCPELSAPAKLVWMVSRLLQSGAGNAGLARASGLSRPTVQTATAQLAQRGWDQPGGGVTISVPGATIPISGAVLTNKLLGVHARIMYGLLLLTPGFSHPFGRFTYAELSALANASRNTVARAVDELAQAEWIRYERAHRRARIDFMLTFPGLALGLAAIDGAQDRLTKAKHFGEGLMREYLSLLIDSDDYEDDATPGWLVNPQTDEHLQLDRYYAQKAAFEFNGPQHYHETKKFSAEQATKQCERDKIKQEMCITRQIPLVIIHPEDLTLKGMQRKVGGLMPLRDLNACDLLIDYLELESSDYMPSVAHLY